MKRLSSVVLLVLLAAPVSAETIEDVFGKNVCYARIYDSAHLTAHPNQQFTRMSLSFRRTNADGVAATPKRFELGVGAMRRGSSEVYGGLAICETAGAAFQCYLEGDMGRFRLTTAPGGRLKMDAPRIVFEGERAFFSVEDGAFTIEGERKTTTGKADDEFFLLDPAPARNCEALDRARP